MRLYAVLLALLSLLDACSPSRPGAELYNYTVVVENQDSFPAEITIRSALGQVYMTASKKVVPAHGTGVWVLGKARPDLVEIDSLALSTGYGPPDFGAGCVFRILYPRGFTEPQEWPRRPQ